MKELAIIRHAKKDGENIAKTEIENIQLYGIAGLDELLVESKPLVLHQGSALLRTEQTIRAFEEHLDCFHNWRFEKYIPSDERLGSDKLFDKFLRNPEIKIVAEESSWYQAFDEFNPAFITEVQTNLVEAIKEAFAKAEENDLIIVVSHTPMIEWLAFYFDEKGKIPRNLQLKELTGFLFTEEDGKITVAEPIGFEL